LHIENVRVIICVKLLSCTLEGNNLEIAVVVRSVWIEAAIDKVWRAVSEPDELVKWYVPGSPWEIPDLRTGSNVTFHLQPNDHNKLTDPVKILGTIVELEPMRRFVIEWELEPSSLTRITFLLGEENGGTRMRIIQGRYDTLPASDTDEGEGYTLSLKNLKALMEGRRIPH